MADLIRDLLADGRTFSFEFFPPRDEEAERVLRSTIEALEPLGPSFVSVTYGAGGSTRDRTRDIVLDIEQRTSMTAMAHLTCMGRTRAEVEALLDEYQAGGIGNILALAGDPPADGSSVSGDFEYASELVELVAARGAFGVGVAAHPEGHPRSAGDLRADRRHLAAKLEVADFGVTQFFFKAHRYLEMMDELASLGCSTPVVPGIIPVTNVAQVTRFASLAGAEFPADILRRLEAGGDRASVRAIGIDIATELAQQLLDAGAPGLHFYTLNRPGPTTAIWRNLGLSDASS